MFLCPLQQNKGGKDAPGTRGERRQRSGLANKLTPPSPFVSANCAKAIARRELCSFRILGICKFMGEYT